MSRRGLVTGTTAAFGDDWPRLDERAPREEATQLLRGPIRIDTSNRPAETAAAELLAAGRAPAEARELIERIAGSAAPSLQLLGHATWCRRPGSGGTRHSKLP